MGFEEKYSVARHAAVTWIAKQGLTAGEKYAYADLNAYADDIALALVMGEGNRGRTVNGMSLEHTPYGWYVCTTPLAGDLGTSVADENL